MNRTAYRSLDTAAVDLKRVMFCGLISIPFPRLLLIQTDSLMNYELSSTFNCSECYQDLFKSPYFVY